MTEEEVRKIAREEIVEFLSLLQTEAKRDPTGMAAKALKIARDAMLRRVDLSPGAKSE
jgi:hypothetical protein